MFVQHDYAWPRVADSISCSDMSNGVLLLCAGDPTSISHVFARNLHLSSLVAGPQAFAFPSEDRCFLPGWNRERSRLGTCLGKNTLLWCLYDIVTSSHFKIQATTIYIPGILSTVVHVFEMASRASDVRSSPGQTSAPGHSWQLLLVWKNFKQDLQTYVGNNCSFVSRLVSRKKPVLRTCFSSFLSKDHGHRVITGHSWINHGNLETYYRK